MEPACSRRGAARAEGRVVSFDEDVLRVRVKAELRKRMRGVRKTMPPEACAARSEKIVRRLLEHPALAGLGKGSRLASFWPIEVRKEVDLRPLDQALRARGVEIAYPAIDPDTGVMTFRLVADPETELDERGMGFAEPSLETPEAAPLDVIIVPALALDPSGQRIGYGAGYYDRTLPKYAPPALPIAVAYDWQLVPDVPSTPHDVRLPFVVTDVRIIDTSTA